jgi:hypothetical protein
MVAGIRTDLGKVTPRVEACPAYRQGIDCIIGIGVPGWVYGIISQDMREVIAGRTAYVGKAAADIPAAAAVGDSSPDTTLHIGEGREDSASSGIKRHTAASNRPYVKKSTANIKGVAFES